MKKTIAAIAFLVSVPCLAHAENKTFKGTGPDGETVDYLWYEELANCAGKFQVLVEELPKLELSQLIDQFALGARVFEANSAKRMVIDHNYDTKKAAETAKMIADNAKLRFRMDFNNFELGYLVENKKELSKQGKLEAFESVRLMCDGLFQDYKKQFPGDLAQ